jgi:hypothetical protein
MPWLTRHASSMSVTTESHQGHEIVWKPKRALLPPVDGPWGSTENVAYCRTCDRIVEGVEARPTKYASVLQHPDGSPAMALLAGGDNSVSLLNCEVNGQPFPDTEVIFRDDRKVTTLTRRAGASTVTTGEVRYRPTKQEDEEAAAQSYRTYLNNTGAATYDVEMPSGEEYVDARLVTADGRHPTIPWQVTHFDPELVKRLMRGTLSRYDLNRLPEVLQAAIDRKSQVDAAARRETVLLLFSPVALDDESLRRIRNHAFNYQGFAEVALAPLRTRATPLRPALSRTGDQRQPGCAASAGT